MNLNIHLVDDSLPMPAYQTPGAVGFDLYARENTTIPARSFGLVPSNLIVHVPPGHGFFVFSRSGTPKKKGLIVGNGVGIVDQDYCGPEDEIKILFYNTKDEPVTVERGERCAQGAIIAVAKVDFVKHTPNKTSRGGFGSTGTK